MLVYLVKKGRKLYNRISELVAKFMKLVETSQRTSAEVTWMAKELRPNGGTSLRDAVSRMERLLVFERMARRMTVTGVPLYERDEHGEVLYVSPAFTMLTGLNTEDTRDNGWMRAVAQEDRTRVMAAFRAAQKEQTFLAEEFTCINAATHERGRVRMEEIPVFYNNEHLVGWLSRWTPLS